MSVLVYRLAYAVLDHAGHDPTCDDIIEACEREVGMACGIDPHGMDDSVFSPLCAEVEDAVRAISGDLDDEVEDRWSVDEIGPPPRFPHPPRRQSFEDADGDGSGSQGALAFLPTYALR